MAWPHLNSQVLKRNAMYGRCGKAPMDEKEMMDLAKAVLLKDGWSLSSVKFILFGSEY